MAGGAGQDHITGGAGRDRITGAGGPDQLYGGRGADILRWRGGNDVVIGGPGRDNAKGGSTGPIFTEYRYSRNRVHVTMRRIGHKVISLRYGAPQRCNYDAAELAWGGPTAPIRIRRSNKLTYKDKTSYSSGYYNEEFHGRIAGNRLRGWFCVDEQIAGGDCNTKPTV